MFRLTLNDRELRVLARLLGGHDDGGDTESREALLERVEQLIDDNLERLEAIDMAEEGWDDRG